MQSNNRTSPKWLWVQTAGACIFILFLSYWLGFLSSDRSLIALLHFPTFPFLEVILLVFIYGARRIALAQKRYEKERADCETVDQIISQFGTPLDIQYKLTTVAQSGTTIGNRIAHSIQAADLNTATTILQISQGMDIEESKTFGHLQSLRTALVLIGLFSTVVFFGRALTSENILQTENLTTLMGELQQALTMTMAGVATSVVLGLQTSRLYNIQQNLKSFIDEVTTKMLPRLLPRYEKGTKEEPGPALLLEKINDYIAEIETWKNQTGLEVNQLKEVLVKHREMLALLPAITLPDGFSELNGTLSKVAQRMDDSRQVTDQALQILSQERDLDLNTVIALLKEMRTDSLNVKDVQDQIVKKLIPKQNELIQQVVNLDGTMQRVSSNLKRTTDVQDAMIGNFEAISKTLKLVSESNSSQFSAEMKELVNAVKKLQEETQATNRILQTINQSGLHVRSASGDGWYEPRRRSRSGFSESEAEFSGPVYRRPPDLPVKESLPRRIWNRFFD